MIRLCLAEYVTKRQPVFNKGEINVAKKKRTTKYPVGTLGTSGTNKYGFFDGQQLELVSNVIEKRKKEYCIKVRLIGFHDVEKRTPEKWIPKKYFKVCK